MSILVTGGAGYIGSHTCVELLNAGHEIVVVDNFSNSKPESLKRITELTKKEYKFYEVDLLDKKALETVFCENQIEAVIHFAGLKAVGESVEIPLHYYYNNITGTLILCEVMKKYDVKKMVFSSSATVYGFPKHVPITEDFPLAATNPYGRTKLMIEEILKDLHSSDNNWGIALLRYFNPIGAHESGRIGEDPNGIPNNLMPYINQVAIGKLDKLNVFGSDYDTHDGTGVRDYIHVVDLAKGHLKALEKIISTTGIDAFNLGTGVGYSVLDVIKNFEHVTSQRIAYSFTHRRSGDIDKCYADTTKAMKELGWKATKNLEDMCRDSWRWQRSNPKGYEEETFK
ncbi:UDP-glucose 4-epimerase GalE [Priestia megaterium]|uniref:UDP-glucose 4-epimerase GalE n=1 Tax=Priestia megaterium TaxID=1404 RepID=UPI0007005929|nr:UDP-glucose 4-epimerase GalE [Priestia megaterium]KQU19323.1 UDP-glucose 4-epimerase [Bacillus sp. Leaf75]USL27630.1 UDP-glucose 4-epimerase GalE [Priestia megaterium]USL33585.1 UDP-glucose 4-epimerase GalE [Priestia megaterium]WDM31652.1 UDP-glucose 4-epimerase GalE [Priestia megaterium]